MSPTLVAEQPRTATRVAPPRSRAVTSLTNPWVIAAVAFTARLAYMAIMRTWDISSIGNHFGFGYETGSIARSIATGHGFASPFRNIDTGPTAWIAPVYPYFCALVFKLFGTFSAASAVVILGMNCLVSALTIIPLYRLGDRVFTRRAAVVAAWTWALVPYFMCWPAALVWEAGISAFLLTALVTCALDLPDAAPRAWLQFGALGGIALLTNPALLTVLPIAALWAVWRSHNRFFSARHFVTSVLICVAVISPWLVRNRVALGKWVFIRDNFAFEFSIGNFPGGSGMGWRGLHPQVNDHIMREYLQKREIAFVAARADYPRKWTTGHTAEFARTTLHRFTAFWDGTSQYWNKFPQDIWTPLPFFTLTIVGLLGCLLALGNRAPGAWLIALTCLLYPWPYYITYAQARYRHAIEPLLVLLAAYFVSELIDRGKERVQAFKATRG